MAYTEVTETSWFSRIGSSFSGMGLGLVLLIGGTGLLWWNEGDFVATRDALNETQAAAVELGDVKSINSSMNGKVVHASGFADTQDVLTDPVFGIGERAIAMERKVEFYQWVEHSKQEKRKKLGGGEETVTTYTYERAWNPRPVQSGQFHDPAARTANSNSVRMNVENQNLRATNVTLGAYRLPAFFISSISGSVPMQVKMSEEAKNALRSNIAGATNTPLLDQKFDNAMSSMATQMMNAAFGSEELIHEQGDTIYIGKTPSNPQIGDVRVTFKTVHPADISIIAKLNGDTFEKFTASNGKDISRLSMGTVSMESMFGKAHSGNSTMTWILRGVGILLVIAGLKCLFAPLAVIADVIPLLGSIIGAGTGLVSTILGLAWSLLIISIAWLRFRPLIGGAMIAAALVLVALLFIRGRKSKVQSA